MSKNVSDKSYSLFEEDFLAQRFKKSIESIFHHKVFKCPPFGRFKFLNKTVNREVVENKKRISNQLCFLELGKNYQRYMSFKKKGKAL